ncbi:MAG: tRNA 4-thiouridine(8) synthase ThiI [Clostridiales bacterium]|nr:tRNA 4-thiouridine(8) synthase ThiI [Clostridiales bacterium]
MRVSVLCKYGEIALKGMNRHIFEKLLRDRIKKRIAEFGRFKVYTVQSTLYILPLDDECDSDGAYEAAKRTFGIAAVSKAFETEKDMDAIIRVAKTEIPKYLEGKKSFKVESKRSDKKFPLNSPEISNEVGGAILQAMHGRVKVDVHNPECVIRVEIRDNAAYVCTNQESAAGGMPTGSNGKALLLLSGGIDSPVAGYMMGRRGVVIEAVHYESFPYTSERARDKVIELAELISRYCGEIHVHVVSLTKLQEAIRDKCDEEYSTLLLRRSMMRLADRIAEKYYCKAIITGESLGQVASQTMEALNVTNPLANRPVFRPLIGTDKEEIVTIARKIGTFETSIQPYEDCCTVFTPRHPKTRPELEAVIEQEKILDPIPMEDEAFENEYTITVGSR